jgi:bifunctional NMN adenylyltransferase/nudix hydrolase
MINQAVGVVVGRFQTPRLHRGHRYLLSHVGSIHHDTLVVLGYVSSLPTARNPLSFILRQQMINAIYPNFVVRPLRDHPDDTSWCQQLDELIEREFPGRQAILYGSRDSFLSVYRGKHETCELEPIGADSATVTRSEAIKALRNTADYRAGVIHGVCERAPIAYQTVDVAIIKPETKQILLGSKATDNGQLRFIGGFVQPSDSSLEAAARREAYEETGGVEISDPKYLGSSHIDDWRYRDSPDGITTVLFLSTYIYGRPVASDDLAHLEWVDLTTAKERLVTYHQPLWEILERHLSV